LHSISFYIHGAIPCENERSMKKSCQLYNVLFLQGQDGFHCTKKVTMAVSCTITKHCFGAAKRHH
ncbi:hypothetical protein, partial [Leclercia sp. M50]|uniref:hypothetical protein n=1 Tax=Leclercia sp. M50 TaxID=3081258 RepID=UPI0030199308